MKNPLFSKIIFSRQLYRYSLTILLFACLLFPVSAAEAIREFTGTNGKTFKGTLLSVESEKATIKRTDGKQFTVDISKFSKEDQTYFKEFAARPKKAPPLTMKDIREYPYTTSFKNRKLSTSSDGIFDELKVSKGKRIRIHGKKQHDGGRVDGRVVNHMGKLVLFPAGNRTGKLVAKLPSLEDVRFYHIAIEFKDTKDRKNVIQSRTLALKKSIQYSWSYSVADGTGTFKLVEHGEDGVTTISSLSASAEEIVGIGFAATVRWSGNEADLSITEDSE